MFEINSFGTLAVFSIIALYLGITIYRNVIQSSGSLRDSEKIHRFLLIVGGILIGLGIGSQQLDIDRIEVLGDSFLISLLIAFAGLVVILYGTTYLKTQLWNPLENISEYSAEFGSNFIATRLPEAGGAELESFSKRFNQNVISLANNISKLEIKVDKVEETLDATVRSGKDLTNTTQSFGDLTFRYGTNADEQAEIISTIGSNVEEFTNWYDQTQDRLKENFLELRSISEMGNLIAINAAVEASNLEIPNPAFDTLAEKLRELARSLETTQDALRKIVDEISITYENFKNSIENRIRASIRNSQNSVELKKEIEKIMQEVSQKDFNFSDNYGNLQRSIQNFKTSIPTAYKK